MMINSIIIGVKRQSTILNYIINPFCSLFFFYYWYYKLIITGNFLILFLCFYFCAFIFFLYYLANLFVKNRSIFILLYVGGLLIVLFLAFFIYFIRNMLVGFICNNFDISLFTSIILVLPLTFFLNRIKRIFFTIFKYNLVKK